MKNLAQARKKTRAFRKKKKLTQTQLANKIEVSQAMISAWELGKKTLSAANFLRLMTVLSNDKTD